MLAGEKLADTREATKIKRKAPKREDTIAKTKAEGEVATLLLLIVFADDYFNGRFQSQVCLITPNVLWVEFS